MHQQGALLINKVCGFSTKTYFFNYIWMGLEFDIKIKIAGNKYYIVWTNWVRL